MSLPAELVLRILESIVEPPSFDRFKQRSSELRRYCLVSRSWQGPAQALLFAHPLLRSVQAVEKYLKEVSSRGGALEARTLRIKGGGSEGKITAGDLKKLLRFTGRGLQELYLVSVFDVAWSDLSISAGENI